MNEEKLKALDAVLTQIEKAYGKGAIMKLGEQAGNTDIEVIPTGCLSLESKSSPRGAFRSTSRSASAGFPAAE